VDGGEGATGVGRGEEILMMGGPFDADADVALVGEEGNAGGWPDDPLDDNAEARAEGARSS